MQKYRRGDRFHNLTTLITFSHIKSSQTLEKWVFFYLWEYTPAIYRHTPSIWNPTAHYITKNVFMKRWDLDTDLLKLFDWNKVYMCWGCYKSSTSRALGVAPWGLLLVIRHFLDFSNYLKGQFWEKEKKISTLSDCSTWFECKLFLHMWFLSANSCSRLIEISMTVRQHNNKIE